MPQFVNRIPAEEVEHKQEKPVQQRKQEIPDDLILQLNNPQPASKKNDYWNSGFGEDFDDIPEARLSEAAVSQSAHSSAAI